MEAFVQTKNGEFDSVNFYQAWRGFNELGYYVNKFEPSQIPDLPITVETPVFAGIPTFQKIIDKLDIGYTPVMAYPPPLVNFLDRNTYILPIKEIRKRFNQTEQPIFIRPFTDRKAFNGHVLRTFNDLRATLHIPEDEPVLCSDVVTFLSEYRVYVLNEEVLDVKRYKGDWKVQPGANVISAMVKSYKNSPVAYCVDVGVTDTSTTVLVEVNDAMNMGNYGISSLNYARMLDARWKEICQKTS